MSQTRRSLEELEQRNDFVRRHIGSSREEQAEMLRMLGVDSLDALIKKVVPGGILSHLPLDLNEGRTPEPL